MTLDLLTMAETAREHLFADRRCGRDWVCACAACRRERVRCPRCKGRGYRHQTFVLLDRGGETREAVDCYTCEASGKVRRGSVRYDRKLEAWLNADSRLVTVRLS